MKKGPQHIRKLFLYTKLAAKKKKKKKKKNPGYMLALDVK